MDSTIPLVAIILAGGKGERFWPLSRERRPKQFLDLTGEGTLLQETYRRIAVRIPPEHILVVTGEQYGDEVLAELPVLPERNVILEPVGRNTAASIGLAAWALRDYPPQTRLLILPADHSVKPNQAFQAAVATGEQAADQGYAVTIGIRPDRPETGYGYLQVGSSLGDGYHRVLRFVEKPELEVAAAFLAEGGYLWNSGVFLFRLDCLRDLLIRHLPDLAQALERIALGGTEALRREFPQLSPVSIDYGIMEKAEKVAVVPAEFAWDDVGSWTALSRIRESDPSGNIIEGAFVGVDNERIIVRGGGRLIAGVGLRDLVIVDTHDALLICPQDRVQEVRRIVVALREQERWEYL